MVFSWFFHYLGTCGSISWARLSKFRENHYENQKNITWNHWLRLGLRYVQRDAGIGPHFIIPALLDLCCTATFRRNAAGSLATRSHRAVQDNRIISRPRGHALDHVLRQSRSMHGPRLL